MDKLLQSISNSIIDGLEAMMTSVAAVRNPDRCPTHPGALLREDILPQIALAKTDVARLLGISRQHLHEILKEDRPVSANVAVRLGKMFGNGPLFWLRMQSAHDAWQAERQIDVSQVPTVHGI